MYLLQSKKSVLTEDVHFEKLPQVIADLICLCKKSMKIN